MGFDCEGGWGGGMCVQRGGVGGVPLDSLVYMHVLGNKTLKKGAKKM